MRPVNIRSHDVIQVLPYIFLYNVSMTNILDAILAIHIEEEQNVKITQRGQLTRATEFSNV